MPTQTKTILDSQFMSKLDRLDLMSRKILAGKMKGERRSKRRGQSVEFADYRNYTVGDDLQIHRLEHLRAARQVVFEDVHGRGRPCSAHPHRHQQEQRFRHAEQTPIHETGCRGARLCRSR